MRVVDSDIPVQSGEASSFESLPVAGEKGEAHTFVLRLWIEERDQQTGCTLWRGHITHVLSGRRQYVQDYPAIIRFICPFVDLSLTRCIRCWLRKRFRRR